MLKNTDPKTYNLIQKEKSRQENTLMLIPSENTVSKAVTEALASVFSNKYAEGYANKRYYQGQEYTDEIEKLAIQRAKKLFKVEAVNVQPYSGSPANFAVYNSVLTVGDKVMGLDLSHGGHLTHGSSVSITGKYFKSIPYYVEKNGLINYHNLKKAALKIQPKLIICGTTAYSKILDWKKFAEIADATDAYLLADISHIAGLIIGGVYPSPEKFVHIITTTTHKTLRGPRGAMIMTTKKGLLKDESLAKKIDRSVFPGIQGGPHINTIAAIAVALKEASKENFKAYASRIVKNAKKLANELRERGYDLVQNGTDTHLLVIDLSNRKISGHLAAIALERAGIVLNRNAVPYDTRVPYYPSGIRLGTPAITNRGMKENEMIKIAAMIDKIITATELTKTRLRIDDTQVKKKEFIEEIVRETTEIKETKKDTINLCKMFPIPENY
jgi:glycine hydroxymethyltransferase